MIRYFFEIVEHSFGRYSWILVVCRHDRRHVIARSNRDWRSPERAADAAAQLQQAIAGAEIMCMFPPIAEFEVLEDVRPLPVGYGGFTDDGAAFAADYADVRSHPRYPVGLRPRTAVVPAGRPTARRGASAAATAPAPAEHAAGNAEPAPEAQAPPAKEKPQAEKATAARKTRATKETPPPATPPANPPATPPTKPATRGRGSAKPPSRS